MQNARAAEGRRFRERIAGTKMRRAQRVENEVTWRRYAEVGMHSRHDTAARRAKAKDQDQAKARARATKTESKKKKKKAPETCLCCGKEGHRNADCSHKNATCSICGKVGHLKAVCRNTNTHEVEKDADAPSPEVTVEEVWNMAVEDEIEDCHCKYTAVEGTVL